ncbi:photosystem II cytochrome c-550 [Cylindrospermopsis curvispora]|uniref:Photosystem II extrinsic protein V n=1 Tax=Cylindrospermopsis curvispora GIHE-G1 TaxID=2666332 RepID=A0A7H0F0V7_9CYAN|nr:photosystem II cytochrome c-550 [Cylindrospermopsis curvispora]QNP29673.1 cytochrome c-550 [Cylindrospermopsis curvispora GIHE-G1]
MFIRLISVVLATVLLSFHLFMGSATAVELDEATRTVKLNEAGDTIVISPKQLQEGKKLFQDTCAQCHAGGVTKTNQNVGLEPEALAGAVPARDNIEGLVAFLKEPKTYDGEQDISEIHPGIKSADIFTEMKNLTEDDLKGISAYILIQPKVVGARWGGGKIYY